MKALFTVIFTSVRPTKKLKRIENVFGTMKKLCSILNFVQNLSSFIQNSNDSCGLLDTSFLFPSTLSFLLAWAGLGQGEWLPPLRPYLAGIFLDYSHTYACTPQPSAEPSSAGISPATTRPPYIDVFDLVLQSLSSPLGSQKWNHPLALILTIPRTVATEMRPSRCRVRVVGYP